MSVEAVLGCCCVGTGPCCPCHPVLGFPTSRLLTWTGSISVSVPPDICNCASTVFGTPTTYAPTYIVNSSATVNGSQNTIGWQNVFSQLDCSLIQPTAITRSTLIEEYEVGPQGYCVYYTSLGSVGSVLRVTRTVFPPVNAFSFCPAFGTTDPHFNRWRVRIGTTISFPTDPNTGQPYTYPPGAGFGTFGRGLSFYFVADNVGCNPGSFSLIPPNPNDPFASGPNGPAFDPYASSWNTLSGCVVTGGLAAVCEFSANPGTVSLT